MKENSDYGWKHANPAYLYGLDAARANPPLPTARPHGRTADAMRLAGPQNRWAAQRAALPIVASVPGHRESLPAYVSQRSSTNTVPAMSLLATPE